MGEFNAQDEANGGTWQPQNLTASEFWDFRVSDFRLFPDLLQMKQADILPSGKHTKKLWKITIFNGKTHYKWPFSIAMSAITRG